MSRNGHCKESEFRRVKTNTRERKKVLEVANLLKVHGSKTKECRKVYSFYFRYLVGI